MNIRTTGESGSLSPELIAAMTAAVRAFLEQETSMSSERSVGISAWRRFTHAGFGAGPSGWRGRD